MSRRNATGAGRQGGQPRKHGKHCEADSCRRVSGARGHGPTHANVATACSAREHVDSQLLAKQRSGQLQRCHVAAVSRRGLRSCSSARSDSEWPRFSRRLPVALRLQPSTHFAHPKSHHAGTSQHHRAATADGGRAQPRHAPRRVVQGVGAACTPGAGPRPRRACHTRRRALGQPRCQAQRNCTGQSLRPAGSPGAPLQLVAVRRRREKGVQGSRAVLSRRVVDARRCAWQAAAAPPCARCTTHTAETSAGAPPCRRCARRHMACTRHSR